MVDIETFKLPEVVDRAELAKWQANIKCVDTKDCPDEVNAFILALASKLGDFGQIGKDHSIITGYELMLSGYKVYDGEPVRAWDSYPLDIPKMVAVDHVTSMHRIFKRKGRQGLIDWCKARVKGTELERLLDNLNVHVFRIENERFKKMMEEINAAKKIDA